MTEIFCIMFRIDGFADLETTIVDETTVESSFSSELYWIKLAVYCTCSTAQIIRLGASAPLSIMAMPRNLERSKHGGHVFTFDFHYFGYQLKFQSKI